MLQWGRGHETAESGDAGHLRFVRLLQWGRGLSTAESAFS